MIQLKNYKKQTKSRITNKMKKWIDQEKNEKGHFELDIARSISRWNESYCDKFKYLFFLIEVDAQERRIRNLVVLLSFLQPNLFLRNNARYVLFYILFVHSNSIRLRSYYKRIAQRWSCFYVF